MALQAWLVHTVERARCTYVVTAKTAEEAERKLCEGEITSSPAKDEHDDMEVEFVEEVPRADQRG